MNTRSDQDNDQDFVQDASVNISTTQSPWQDSGFIVRYDIRLAIEFANRAVLGQILAIFGTGANLINLFIFHKMGFTETINICLFSLSLTDMLSCVTLIWSNFWHTPDLLGGMDNMPFNYRTVRIITGDYPHILFVKISGCVTAYVAFERCLCVTFPLTIKRLITPKKVIIFIISAFVFIASLYAPVYYVNQLGWKFNPDLNRTILDLLFSRDRRQIEQVLFPIRGTFLHWLFFGVTILSSVILVRNLKKHSELFRNKGVVTSTSTSMTHTTSRDTRVTSLVVLVSAVFVICLTPVTVCSLASTFEPGLTVQGKYRHLLGVLFSFNFALELINADMNIFIYYFRSSKYKAVFDEKIMCKKLGSK